VLSFEFSNTDWCINRRKFRFGLPNLFKQLSIHPDYHLLTAENTAKLQKKGFPFDSERTRRHKKNKII
jgi:hypothetical protein